MKMIIALVLSFLSISIFAQEKVTLNVTLNPAGSFQAVSQKVKGDLLKQNETFTATKVSVSVESFKTGIDLRDEHFWKHLNSEKYPKAVLTELKAQNGSATAVLELNGVKKNIKISYKENDGYVNAQFDVLASDFGLAKAEYLGVGVADLVKVEVTLAFQKK